MAKPSHKIRLRYLFISTLCGALLISGLSLYFTYSEKFSLKSFVSFLCIDSLCFTDELAQITQSVNQLSESAHQTQHEQVFIFNNETPKTIIMLSPYFDSSRLITKTPTNTALIESLNDYANSIETGHLFLIENNTIVDHQLLSGLIAPISTIQTGKIFYFELAPKITSGRPVTVTLRAD